MNDEETAYIEGLQQQNASLNENLQKAQQGLISSSLAGRNDNLITYQLDLSDTLEKVERLLRGEVIKETEEGEFYMKPIKKITALVLEEKKATGGVKFKYYISEFGGYKEIDRGQENNWVVISVRSGNKEEILEDAVYGKKMGALLKKRLGNGEVKRIGYVTKEIVDRELQPFNEYGVQLLMNEISFYVNRNTILSRYSEERIQQILHEFGYTIADLILNNFDIMGMDTVYKRSRYNSIVLNLKNMIESTYRRALFGGERDSLGTARVVTQNATISDYNQGYHPGPQKQKFRLLKWRTWG